MAGILDGPPGSPASTEAAGRDARHVADGKRAPTPSASRHGRLGAPRLNARQPNSSPPLPKLARKRAAGPGVASGRGGAAIGRGISRTRALAAMGMGLGWARAPSRWRLSESQMDLAQLKDFGRCSTWTTTKVFESSCSDPRPSRTYHHFSLRHIEALDICKRRQLSLVISDVAAPGHDGMEFLRLVRGMPRMRGCAPRFPYRMPLQRGTPEGMRLGSRRLDARAMLPDELADAVYFAAQVEGGIAPLPGIPAQSRSLWMPIWPATPYRPGSSSSSSCRSGDRFLLGARGQARSALCFSGRPRRGRRGHQWRPPCGDPGGDGRARGGFMFTNTR